MSLALASCSYQPEIVPAVHYAKGLEITIRNPFECEVKPRLVCEQPTLLQYQCTCVRGDRETTAEVARLIEEFSQ